MRTAHVDQEDRGTTFAARTSADERAIMDEAQRMISVPVDIYQEERADYRDRIDYRDE